MTGLLHDLNERAQAVAGDWTKYTVIGSFVLYVLGYLVLRFHLTAIGVATDLQVLDERYLFTGARFLVYLVASAANVVFVGLVVAVILSVLSGVLPRIALGPRAFAWIGIVVALVMIQFVMRQCFFFGNLLLASDLPAEPAWLVAILLDEPLMTLYFSGLVAGCVLPIWALVATWNQAISAVTRGLLAFLAAVQVLLLPVNYGVLIVDKDMPRVASLGAAPLAAGEEAWLVWEGATGVTFLIRNQATQRRALVTLAKEEVKRTEIVGFDRILPRLFGSRRGAV